MFLSFSGSDCSFVAISDAWYCEDSMDQMHRSLIARRIREYVCILIENFDYEKGVFPCLADLFDYSIAKDLSSIIVTTYRTELELVRVKDYEEKCNDYEKRMAICMRMVGESGNGNTVIPSVSRRLRSGTIEMVPSGEENNCKPVPPQPPTGEITFQEAIADRVRSLRGNGTPRPAWLDIEEWYFVVYLLRRPVVVLQCTSPHVDEQEPTFENDDDDDDLRFQFVNFPDAEYRARLRASQIDLLARVPVLVAFVSPHKKASPNHYIAVLDNSEYVDSEVEGEHEEQCNAIGTDFEAENMNYSNLSSTSNSASAASVSSRVDASQPLSFTSNGFENASSTVRSSSPMEVHPSASSATTNCATASVRLSDRPAFVIPLDSVSHLAQRPRTISEIYSAVQVIGRLHSIQFLRRSKEPPAFVCSHTKRAYENYMRTVENNTKRNVPQNERKRKQSSKPKKSPVDRNPVVRDCEGVLVFKRAPLPVLQSSTADITLASDGVLSQHVLLPGDSLWVLNLEKSVMKHTCPSSRPINIASRDAVRDRLLTSGGNRYLGDFRNGAIKGLFSTNYYYNTQYSFEFIYSSQKISTL